MNKFYPPIDIIEKADKIGYKYLYLDKNDRWFASTVEIEYNPRLDVFHGVTNVTTTYMGVDGGRSTFHYGLSVFSISEWASKNRQRPDEPSITLTLDEAREMIDAITKSVVAIFPGKAFDNMWFGSPFHKLATFVDAHEKGEEE